MIVEDQNMSDCFATYGDRPRRFSSVLPLLHPAACRFEYSSFSLKFSNAEISENLRFLARCVRRHSGRIEREQLNDEGKDYWRAHGFLHHRKKIARTRKPSRTPSNGLETANQKERS